MRSEVDASDRAREQGEERYEDRTTCSTHRALIVARIPRIRACDSAREATRWGVDHNESARICESALVEMCKR